MQASVDLSDLCSIANDEDFVQRAYQRVLGRDCDVAGFVNCLEMLRGHTPRRIILLNLVNSDEARARAAHFTGIPDSPAHSRSRPGSSLSGRVFRRPLGRIYEGVRRLWLSPFSSIHHVLSLVLREVAVRTDSVLAKTDRVHWALSEKLDAQGAALSAEQKELRHALEHTQSSFTELLVMFASLAHQPESERRHQAEASGTIEGGHRGTTFSPGASRITGPLSGLLGDNIFATQVDGFILGLPGEEWRLVAYHAFRGNPEPGVTRRFLDLLRQGSIVVDVGANVGLYTLHAARLLGRAGKIHSFEPTPRTFRLLRDNVQVNGFLEMGTVELHQAAVADKAGLAQLAIFPNNCGHNTLFFEGNGVARTQVETVTLDEVLQAEPRVDLVKIDAEGAEPSILRGMRGILRRSPGIRILLEFAPSLLHRAGVSPEDFLDDIDGLNLEVRRIDDETGSLHEVTREQLAGAFSTNLDLRFREAAR
ncbi:MAG: FkbM family methyltransferase [Bryobacteraceae bacterium]